MKPGARVLLLITAFACSVTGLPALDGRIIGGALATAGQFPYVVSVTESDRHICGGFIYSERWVVTTASCIFGKTVSKLKIVAGQVSLSLTEPSEQTISVLSVYIVNIYNSTYQQNDVALLKLTDDIIFDENVDFVNYTEDDTVSAQVAGWGANFEDGVESVNLRYGVVDIMRVTSAEPYCGVYVYNTDFKPASMICAVSSASAPDDDAGSPCHFDEGSPLMQTNANGQLFVVGIVSKLSDCSLDSPSVYTRVSVYYSWFFNTAGPQPTRS